jgi:L-lactate dehydrogenase (cytochrome)
MLDDCYSILDLRERARQRLPAPIFNILDGAAETEATARRNTTAFDGLNLVPRCLVDVAHVDTATRLFGQPIQWPVYCSPTGSSRLFHPEGELAVARAAARSGTFYGLSTASTRSIESVAASSEGPKLFQLYICRDRDLTRQLVERAKQSGYVALCVTVDTPVVGKCERENRDGLYGHWTGWPLSTFLGFARHPQWVLGRLGKHALTLANFAGPDGKVADPEIFRRQLDPSITWKDIRDVADLWRGPLAVKGIMSTDDARRAADAGATAVVVSNHGGRQLDGAAASIEVLPEIVAAVGSRAEVVLDGGVRRGVHVLKALAAGAKACSIGRPYLYGLSAGGEAGVAKALSVLRSELELAMRLSGCPNLASIDGSLIRNALKA